MHNSLHAALSCFALLCSAACLCAQPPVPLLINGADRGLTMPPSFAIHPGGRVTFVWSSYDRGQERLLTVALDARGVSRQTELSPGPGIYSNPAMVATGPSSGWVFWMRQVNGAWQVVGREYRDGAWLPMTVLSGERGNALFPAAAVSGRSVVLAFEDHSVDPQRIALRRWDGRAWSAAEPVSGGTIPAYRPALAAAEDGRVWAVWDAYVRERRVYSVYARRMLPAAGAEERLSPPDANCLKPVALFTPAHGLAVAWVSTGDVTGGGIVDHWDTVQVALRGPSGWQLIRSSGGEEHAARLLHGLLPFLEPQFRPVSGYSGLGRHPQLAELGGALWLLWERKSVAGSISSVPGQLCGARFDGRAFGAPVLLDEGLVEYQVAADPRHAGATLKIAGRTPQHGFLTLDVGPQGVGRYAEAEWKGWSPVTLPLRQYPPRASIELAGRTQFLYWGDLHVHSALSPDAEGEPDELMHYARDKSRMDVVVVQENDSNSWLQTAYIDRRLTASEYALSVYYSRKYTRAGEFVALPGWEWSQRTDDGRPNHRTVMFAGSETPILRHTENGGNFDQLCDVVEAAGGVMNTQHGEFRLVDRPCDANVEVASGWDIYIQPPGKIHHDLSAGYRVGFVATGDNHRRTPGYGGGITGIYAPELTPSAILDAIRRHHVFATTGARVLLDARANGVFMGEDVPAQNAVALTLRAVAAEPIARAVLVGDGKAIHTADARGESRIECSFTDRPGKGFHWYYWRVELARTVPPYSGNSKVAEGNIAWSSPHRVTVAE